MTEYGLVAHLNVLAQHAENRYEDALVCAAIRNYVMQVGAIPDCAWGRFPWVGRWKREWAVARDYRVAEATTARDVFGNTAAGLHQVVVDTAGTDVAISMDFENKALEANGVLLPHLNALRAGNGAPNRAHPGGDVAPPAYHAGAPIPVRYDTGTPLGQRLDRLPMSNGLNIPQLKAPGTVTGVDRAREYYGDSPGHRELWRFITEHYHVLTEAEDLVDEYGPGLTRYPTRNFIDEAKDAWPRVITERADLIDAVAANYALLRTQLLNDINALRNDWWSPSGSRAYFNHANNLLRYLDRCKAEAEWLSTEGKKAGDAVDKLMLAYAEAGFKQIDVIIGHVKAVKDELESFCQNITDPVKALTAAVGGLADMMLAKWAATNESAQNLLALAKTAQDAAPDLGDVGHSAATFPYPTSGEDWKHTPWTPGRSTMPVVPA
jgi:hypothetical protein